MTGLPGLADPHQPAGLSRALSALLVLVHVPGIVLGVCLLRGWQPAGAWRLLVVAGLFVGLPAGWLLARLAARAGRDLLGALRDRAEQGERLRGLIETAADAIVL